MAFAALAGGAAATQLLKDEQAAKRLRAEATAYGAVGTNRKWVCPRCNGEGKATRIDNLDNEYDVELGKDVKACRSWITCIFVIPTLCCFGFLCTQDTCGLCGGKGWIPHYPLNAKPWVDTKAQGNEIISADSLKDLIYASGTVLVNSRRRLENYRKAGDKAKQDAEQRSYNETAQQRQLLIAGLKKLYNIDFKE